MTVSIVPAPTDTNDPLTGWQDAADALERAIQDMEGARKKVRAVPDGKPALIREMDATLDSLRDMRNDCLDTYWDRMKARCREART